MTSRPPISREEVLGGLLGGRSTRQANSIFSMIEARTAQLVADQRSVNAPYMTAAAREERNLAYLQAIAASVPPRDRPTIQSLERVAVRWADLVPDNPAVRAALAKKFGEEHSFTRQTVPRIGVALGLADDAVASAFNRQFGASIESIFTAELTPLERARWAWLGFNDWLDGLSPFWTAFALTVTETVGAGILALPIALATIGPLAGAVLLIFFGLLNLVTVGYMAEASARNTSIRYGSAFVGQLVGDFLGPTAVLVLRLGLFCLCCTVLVAFYTGFSRTLGEISGLPDPVWIAVIFGLGVFLIVRKTLFGTVASALLIGFINISILILLSLMALTHARWDNVTHTQVPFLFGEPFDASVLQLVFGVVMVAYFGHISVSNCAQAVLRREPDGRSLKHGTMAAMALAIAVYVLWCIGIGGAVEPDRLASEQGTSLVPLAEEIGPSVYILGTIFVVLGLGMSSIHYSLGIFNMAREVFTDGVAKGRPSAPANLTASGLLQLAPDERRVLAWLMRRSANDEPPAGVAEIARGLDVDETKALKLLMALSRGGLVQGEDRDQGTVFIVVAALQRPGARLSTDTAAIFDKLTDGRKKPKGRRPGLKFGTGLRGRIEGRFQSLPNLAALVPICLIFLYSQWAYFADQQSFTKPLELVGALLTPILAGLFPLLLLIASRRCGSSIAGARLPKVISNPIVIGVIAFLSFASLLLHGTVIWDEPVFQLAALVAAGVMVFVIIDLFRRHALAPVLLVEISHRAQEHDLAHVAVAFRGDAVPVALSVGYGDRNIHLEPPTETIENFADCRVISLDLPRTPARALHILTNKISVAFERQPLAGQLTIVSERGEPISFDLSTSDGRIKTAFPDLPCQLQFRFLESSA